MRLGLERFDLGSLKQRHVQKHGSSLGKTCNHSGSDFFRKVVQTSTGKNFVAQILKSVVFLRKPIQTLLTSPSLYRVGNKINCLHNDSNPEVNKVLYGTIKYLFFEGYFSLKAIALDSLPHCTWHINRYYSG
ncbi:hypothetical protein Bbelb_135790 [Branchiostoma belcheri]|nr:hypothetical protein Bbelb_135790 [Branchiostoma belcheri]